MDKGLGTRLGMLRSEHKWSCRFVAGKVGVSKSSITNYENNRNRPSVDTLARLAALYKVSTDYLLGIKSDVSDLTADMSGLTSEQRKSVQMMIETLENDNKRLKK